MNHWHLLLLTACSSLAVAQTAPSSFTQTELKTRADAFHQVIGKERKSLEIAINASQFFGYVAGHIDARKFGPNADHKLVECTRRLKMNEIVRRTAELIIDSKPDMDETVDFSIRFAIEFACTESMWKLSADAGIAPKWTKFSENNRLVAYFQPSSTVTAGAKTVWVLYDYKEEQESPRSGRRYRSEKGQHEIDCRGERSRTVFFTWHERPMGDGAVVYTGSKALPWEPESPDSVGKALAAAVCQRQ